ncbi:MAG: biotin/lipoyl-containing protein, partial [Pseudomonadota bacterium]
TNLGFLKRLADHSGFSAGEVDTGLIARDMEALIATDTARQELVRQAAALASLDLVSVPNTAAPWDSKSGWRLWGTADYRVALILKGERFDMKVTQRDRSAFEIDGQAIQATVTESGFVLSQDGRDIQFGVHRDADSITIFDDGQVTRFERVDLLDTEGASQTGEDVVLAPMPGLVTQVSVSTGDPIEAGAPLLVLEAMKMEHQLRAPRDGTVADVLTHAGAQVQNGTVLIRLEEADG